uniref:Uncharacterized protein n=1 Tax=Heterorhabditis bacteriophora TaxID=37862 RepID=A0A1I7W6Z5_HETBA
MCPIDQCGRFLARSKDHSTYYRLYTMDKDRFSKIRLMLRYQDLHKFRTVGKTGDKIKKDKRKITDRKVTKLAPTTAGAITSAATRKTLSEGIHTFQLVKYEV